MEFHSGLRLPVLVVGLYVGYIYLGYPLLIALLAHRRPAPIKNSTDTFRCSVLISCYNESVRLIEKVHQILALEGNDAIIEVLIEMDGSDEQAEKITENIHDQRVKQYYYPIRRGKPAVMNDLMEKATGEVLLMMDVRQKLNKQVLKALLPNFADQQIGVVSGELVFVRSLSDTSAAVGIDAYWRYEKWIRKNGTGLFLRAGGYGSDLCDSTFVCETITDRYGVGRCDFAHDGRCRRMALCV